MDNKDQQAFSKFCDEYASRTGDVDPNAIKNCLREAGAKIVYLDGHGPVAWRWRDTEHEAWNHINWEPHSMDYKFVEALYLRP